MLGGMPSVPAPIIKDASHRTAVLGRLAWTIPVNTLLFVVLGPVVGTLIALMTPPFGLMTIAAIAKPDTAPLLFWLSLGTGYVIGSIPAAFSGFWVALLSPFSASRKHFFLGAAAIGAASTWIFAAGQQPSGGPILPIFLAIIGTVSAVVCAVLTDQLRRRPFLESRSARRKRRDQLARARAERLARARKPS